MIERCKRCSGSKQIAPMGGLYKICDECNGVGHIDIAVVSADVAAPTKVIVKSRKKWGRGARHVEQTAAQS